MNAYRGKHVSSASRRSGPSFRRGRHQVRNRHRRRWLIFLIVFVIVKIAFNASIVIYDSMLNDISTDEEMDELSSKGYALGYIGSCIPFIICLVFVVFSDMMDSTPTYFTFENAVIISLFITAGWWLVMSLPLFKEYEQKRFIEQIIQIDKEINQKANALVNEIRRKIS